MVTLRDLCEQDFPFEHLVGLTANLFAFRRYDEYKYGLVLFGDRMHLTTSSGYIPYVSRSEWLSKQIPSLYCYDVIEIDLMDILS